MKKLALPAFLAVLSLHPLALAQGAPPPAPESTAEPATLELTLEGALRLARQSSPAALTAPLVVREAEAGRVEASIFPRHNPLLELELGPRLIADDPQGVVFSVGLSQNLDLGGGASARLKRVDALVDLAHADADTAMQKTLRAVGHATYRGLWAQERLALAEEAERIARSVLGATKKRIDAGDATALELNVSKGAFARAVADRTSAEATVEQSKGELRALLGLSSTASFVLKGSLAHGLKVDLTSLKKGAQGRGELLALAADVALAEADSDLAGALAAPQMSFGARYELEDTSQHTILGTLTMTLPIFDHAQGLAAQAEAKAARAKVELAAQKSQVDAEVETATRVARKRAEASEAFAEAKGVESLEQNLALAIKGYQAGESGLSDLLLVRRELLETEASRIDRLLELRSAEIDVLYAAGRLP